MKNFNSMSSRHCEKQTEWETRQSPITARPEINVFRFASFAMTKAFTLVELIVVITILVILGTIAFISLGGYAGSARDGARIENLANLQKGLSLFQVKSGTYPMPEGAVNITASGIIIGYQGFAWDTVATLANLSKGGTLDPSDALMYTTYSTNATREKMQVMAFLEDGGTLSFVPEASADPSSDYSKRTPVTKGDPLGILLGNSGSTLHQPVQESGTWVDIVNTGTGYTAYLANQETVIGTGASLFSSIYNRRSDLFRDKTIARYDPSLVGYWDMETLSGSSLVDLSRYANHGNGTGGLVLASSIRNGKFGSAMVFSGSGNAIEVMEHSSLKPQKITMSAWINGTNYLNYPYIVSNGDPSSDYGASNGLFLNVYNFQMIWAHITSTGALSQVTGGSPKENQWHYATVSHDGVSMKLYLDGTLVSTKASPVINWNSEYRWLFIGRAVANWTTGNIHSDFRGLIDEVRIYNRALSDAEIQAHYHAAK